MSIIVDLIYICSIVCLTIYIYIEKRRSYQKGFSDGFNYYSEMAEDTLRHVSRWNKKAEEDGIPLTAYVESIKPLNGEESEVNADDT